MKKKNYDYLFFSKTRDFLDIYLEKQCSLSTHTVKAYRDALTVFRRYVLNQGVPIKTFGFEDCTRDFMLGFMEYLQREYYEKSSCNYGHFQHLPSGRYALDHSSRGYSVEIH